ncbi:MAG TPA: GFA family protein [Candidatus Eisenbacteria bacterium]|nr:GFA family protein [Candidatus Eisenbacteria bacterium]
MRGQCLCGAVVFEVNASSLKLYRCHCSLCRRQSGTASSLAAIVPNSQFRWLVGQDRISSWKKGGGFRSDFCSICGSPVPNPLRTTHNTWVPAGLLDREASLSVVADIYLSSRAAWDPTQPTGVQHEELPEFKVFLGLLRGE